MLSHIFPRHRDDFHPILQHLVHYGRNTFPYVLHRQHLATVCNIAAAGNNVGNIALHNQLMLSVWVDHKRQHLATVCNIAAAGNNVGNIALHNQLMLSVWVDHKDADDLAGVVKGNLIRLLVLGKELREMCLPSRHAAVKQRCL